MITKNKMANWGFIDIETVAQKETSDQLGGDWSAIMAKNSSMDTAKTWIGNG